MTTVKILIVVNIFDRYNFKNTKWARIFQIMTYAFEIPGIYDFMATLMLSYVSIIDIEK